MDKQVRVASWKTYLTAAALCSFIVVVLFFVPLKATRWHALASAVPAYLVIAAISVFLVTILLGIPIRVTVRNFKATVWRKKYFVILALCLLFVVILPSTVLQAVVWNVLVSLTLKFVVVALLSALLMSIIPGWKKRYLTLALLCVLFGSIMVGVRCA